MYAVLYATGYHLWSTAVGCHGGTSHRVSRDAHRAPHRVPHILQGVTGCCQPPTSCTGCHREIRRGTEFHRTLYRVLKGAAGCYTRCHWVRQSTTEGTTGVSQSTKMWRRIRYATTEYPKVLYGVYPSGTGRHRAKQGSIRCHRGPQGGHQGP